jgi:hypothetical protein
MVKSAGMVLGPFTLSELTEAVRSRHVSILDEVRTPSARWNLLREFPELAELVKIARSVEPSKELTDVAIDLDETKPDWPTIPGAHGTLVPPKKSQNQTASQTQVQNSKPPKPVTPDRMAPGTLKKSSPSPKNPWLAFASGTVLALVALYLVFTYGISSSNSLQPSADYFALAKKAKDKGLYDNALQYFNRGKEQKRNTVAAQIEFIPLLLLFPNEANVAETLIHQAETQKGMVRTPLWTALLRMRQGQFTEAQNLLKDFVQNNPDDFQGRLNQLTNSYFLNAKEISASDQSFFEKHRNQSELAFIVPALISLRNLNAESGEVAKKTSEAAVQALTSQLEFVQLYRFETQLLIALLEKNVDGVRFKTTIDSLIQENPLESKDRLQDLEIDNQLLETQRWMDICTDVFQGAQDEIKKVLIKAQCQVYGGQWEVALQTLSTHPESEEFKPLMALVQWKTHHLREALALAGMKRDKISTYVRGRACLEMKEVSCVQEAIKVLQSQDKNSLRLAELSIRLNLMLDKRDLASKALAQAQQENGKFKPFIEFEDEIFNGN